MVRTKWSAVRASGETVGTTLHHACYYVLAYFFGESSTAFAEMAMTALRKIYHEIELDPDLLVDGKQGE
jgi:hypothetical protein